MNKSRAFLSFLGGLDRSRTGFAEPHFSDRKGLHSIGEGVVEDFLFNRSTDLEYVEEERSSLGLRRFKAYYAWSKRKVLFVVMDVEENGNLRVVTAYLIDKEVQLEAIRNANRYARFAKRLR